MTPTYSHLVLEDWVCPATDKLPGWGKTVVGVRRESVHYTRGGAHHGASVSIHAHDDCSVFFENVIEDGNVVEAQQAVVDQRVRVGHGVCGCGWLCLDLLRVGVCNFHPDRTDLVALSDYQV